MSIEAEFIVQTEPFQHVKVTLSDKDLISALVKSAPDLPFGEALGDYWASLRAAVLYGRDKALEAVAKAEPPVRDEPFASTQEYMESSIAELAAQDSAEFHDAQDATEEALEGASELLQRELGATVLEVTEKPQKGPSSPSTDRPWKSKPKAKKQRPWEEGAPATKPEPAKTDKRDVADDWGF